VAGTLTGLQQVQKIVTINGRNFDLRADGLNLVVSYADKPGSLGRIGTLLGDAGIDILAAALSQDLPQAGAEAAGGPGATVILRLSRKVDDGVVDAIANAVGATLIEQVDLS
ncbi:MAG: ACT domain-containing protein, partial [Gordonia sp. (in: high G+C Gram-positive bacteria)]